jgi:ribosomal subunit interface protein
LHIPYIGDAIAALIAVDPAESQSAFSTRGIQMNLQFTGKNVDPGGAFKAYEVDRLSISLEKYITGIVEGHVRLAKERRQFQTDCSIRLRNGVILQANGNVGDAYTSADAALGHLEKRASRYGRRLKSHQVGSHRPLNGRGAQDYRDRVSSDNLTEKANFPVIVAEFDGDIPVGTVGDAARRLDHTESSFLVFKTESEGDLNVVYRRSDGKLSWIESSPGVAGSSRRTGGPTSHKQG